MTSKTENLKMYILYALVPSIPSTSLPSPAAFHHHQLKFQGGGLRMPVRCHCCGDPLTQIAKSHIESRMWLMDPFPSTFTHGSKIISSTLPLAVLKREFPFLDKISAGFESEGTHSIQTLQPSCRVARCHDVAIIWMSQDLLHPFVSALQTY